MKVENDIGIESKKIEKKNIFISSDLNFSKNKKPTSKVEEIGFILHNTSKKEGFTPKNSSKILVKNMISIYLYI